jgi:hypothetical protein
MNQAIDIYVDIWYAINMQYEHSRNQVYLMNFHLVWCPKRRRKVLVGEVSQRLREIINQVAAEKKVKILASKYNPTTCTCLYPAHRRWWYIILLKHSRAGAPIYYGRNFPLYSNCLRSGLIATSYLPPVMCPVRRYVNISRLKAQYEEDVQIPDICR